MVLTLVTAALAFQGGLVKKDVQVGKGLEAKPGDYVTMEYTGTLLNGKKFDSSVGRAPFNFVLGAGQVIKGWDQGIAGMKIGGKRKLRIPAALAYGDRAMGDDIPANSTLLFDVELKKIDRLQDLNVVKKGSGAAVTGRDQVKIDFTLTVKGGKQIGSNAGQAAVPFTVGSQTLPGLNASLIGMKLGEKRKVTIPPAMAFGEAGNPQAGVPANASLLLEVSVRELNGKVAK